MLNFILRLRFLWIHLIQLYCRLQIGYSYVHRTVVLNVFFSEIVSVLQHFTAHLQNNRHRECIGSGQANDF